MQKSQICHTEDHREGKEGGISSTQAPIEDGGACSKVASVE